jgi:hypothetical protein
VRGRLTTPKNGKGRQVAVPPGLASALLDLLAERRRDTLQRGWPDIPEWVFLSATGGPLDERNFNRTWERVRRRARKSGVRPLKLHCTRHTYASTALAAGKSLRWVAEQLDYQNPEFTLRTYAHLMPQEETDLSFADFGGKPAGLVRGRGGVSRVPKRPSAAPATEAAPESENAPALSGRRRYQNLEHETRFELATLTLAKRTKGEGNQ